MTEEQRRLGIKLITLSDLLLETLHDLGNTGILKNKLKQSCNIFTSELEKEFKRYHIVVQHDEQAQLLINEGIKEVDAMINESVNESINNPK